MYTSEIHTLFFLSIQVVQDRGPLEGIPQGHTSAGAATWVAASWESIQKELENKVEGDSWLRSGVRQQQGRQQ